MAIWLLLSHRTLSYLTLHAIESRFEHFTLGNFHSSSIHVYTNTMYSMQVAVKPISNELKSYVSNCKLPKWSVVFYQLFPIKLLSGFNGIVLLFPQVILFSFEYSPSFFCVFVFRDCTQNTLWSIWPFAIAIIRFNSIKSISSFSMESDQLKYARYSVCQLPIEF